MSMLLGKAIAFGLAGIIAVLGVLLYLNKNSEVQNRQETMKIERNISEDQHKLEMHAARNGDPFPVDPDIAARIAKNKLLLADEEIRKSESLAIQEKMRKDANDFVESQNKAAK
jgi:hypothetical protein